MAANAWPVRTSEYVDLWLHGFAMVTGDTSHVSLFEPAYRARMLALRHQRNVLTSLDANQERLSQGFVENPALVNAEFLIFEFSSFQQLVQVGNQFVQSEGYPPAITDIHTQRLIAVLQQNFKTVADRDWLRLFLQALQDEDTRFYHDYWTSQQQARASARHTLDSLWATTYRARFARYLRPVRLGDGSFILSLPLGGEGRTVTDPQLGNAVAGPYPSTEATAVNALYVFAHEIIDRETSTAIANNTPTAAQRGNDTSLPLVPYAQLYGATAQVRGGALLLQRIAPELVQGYMRYYLEVAGAPPPPAGDATTAFEDAFYIPGAIRNGIEYQLGLVLGGI